MTSFDAPKLIPSNSVGSTHPLVSCIIPVYNGETFLAETLDSVLAQTHPIHEILVVDDGSTDGTRVLVEKVVAQTKNRVRYFWQANSGPAAARNQGIQAATGEFITFLDADDLWLPEKTERQLERFVTRPELGISVSHIQNFWMEDLRDEEERMRDHPRAQPVAGYVLPTLMARRSVFEEIGLLNPTLLLSDSTEWFMRAQEAKVIDELLPDVLVQRRMHRDSHSRRNTNISHAEYFRLLKRHTRKNTSITGISSTPQAGVDEQPTQTKG